MLQTNNYQQNLSSRLSGVLDDIGVNEEMILKGRRAVLLLEATNAIALRSIANMSTYTFGSRSEGTTTVGINSDIDRLCCIHHFNVIQDYSEWESGFTNLLMIQDSTSPGYCLLQRISDVVPLPATHVLDADYVRDASERVLQNNTLFRDIWPAGVTLHGPSWAKQGIPGISDVDVVPAFHCKSWPYQARTWLDRQGTRIWPTTDMKRFAENNGCFVVPVGSKVSHNPELEWRISTSQAERCLMFSLNITQIRCYVLMKMILKTFLHHAGEGQITSFMCKTVLFHCVQNTHPNVWQKNNLIRCLLCCLHLLYKCLQQENCPHFIIPGNNLMVGQFSLEVKALLLERMFQLIQSDGLSLLGVQIDDLGQRLQIKMNTLYQITETIPSRMVNCLNISCELLNNTAKSITGFFSDMLSETIQNSPVATVQNLLNELTHYERYYREGSPLEQRASSFLSPLVCSTIGTIVASINIETNNKVSPLALDWLSAGLNSYVSSGRLKLASVFYSVGNFEITELILRHTEEYYDFLKVEPACNCYTFSTPKLRIMFGEVAYHENEEAVRSVCAFCVQFTCAEIHCVPQELQYEMYRSTQDELLHRDEDKDYWMDWAVVDSLPYLYFLQYKTYRHLRRLNDQQQALANLTRTIVTEENLGHRETALNLLGQCMEQENQPHKALHCYLMSLKVRERCNAARFHICKLLARLLR